MNSAQVKQCQNCKQEFTIEPDDFAFYEKMKVPPPTFCPECRFQRRLTYRNERNLYKRKCDLCGKEIVSCFLPDIPQVYCLPCWWSDNWDPLEYGRNYDFSKSFFAQFAKLRTEVPKASLDVTYQTMINSDYCHMAGELKNCYLVTHANENENCFYSSALVKSKDSGELLSCKECELCLENVNCVKCHRLYFSLDCENCYDVTFSRNCVGCHNCFGCVNLRNKQYHIFNKQYSKEEYFLKLKEYDFGSYQIFQEIKGKVRSLWDKYPQKYMHGQHNAKVTGDYIYHSKNSFNCYVAAYAEDCKYCQYLMMKPTAQCYDYTEWGNNAELIYESINVGEGFSNSKFCQQCWGNCKNLEYSNICIGASDLFGCVGLRKKQYCILNKQYSEEEYRKLRQKIINQMDKMPYEDKAGRTYRYGEFFPPENSLWGYNETTVSEYFPLDRAEIEKRGYRWVDIEKYRGVYKPTLKAVDIPDNIKDVHNSILNEIIECITCKKPYRIIRQEFDFYKNQDIAVPRECSECRYKKRFRQRNSFKLWHRQCMCDYKVFKNTVLHEHHKEGRCPNEFETSYSPERPEVVYCEQCYQKEVI